MKVVYAYPQKCGKTGLRFTEIKISYEDHCAFHLVFRGKIFEVHCDSNIFTPTFKPAPPVWHRFGVDMAWRVATLRA